MGKHALRDQGGWIHRRRIIYSTLIFCATIILYITVKGADTKIYDTIATSAFSLMGAVIMFYVTGATYQDVSSTKILSKAKEETTEDGEA